MHTVPLVLYYGVLHVTQLLSTILTFCPFRYTAFQIPDSIAMKCIASLASLEVERTKMNGSINQFSLV